MSTSEATEPTVPAEEKKEEETQDNSPAKTETVTEPTTTEAEKTEADKSEADKTEADKSESDKSEAKEEVKENGDATPAENSAPESTPAAAEENPAPECDAKPEEIPAHVTEAEELFTKISEGEDNLVKKYLTKDILDKLKTKKTTLGGTLADVIRSGLAYATDPEAFKVFSDLFDPIIKDIHKLPGKKNISQPGCNFGDPKFENLDSDGKYIVGTKISVSRNVESYSFATIITEENRKEVETKVKEVLAGLDDEVKGTYHSLADLTEEIKKELSEDGNLFTDDNELLKSAGGHRDWPNSRGVFVSENKNFVVWLNEEDHIKAISVEKSGDINAAYKRLVAGVKGIESKVKYSRDGKVGFVTACPFKVGTTINASVHIKLPCLAAANKIQQTVEKFGVAVGEEKEGVFEVTNKRSVGLNELQCFTELYNGVKELIRVEKELAWRPENMDDMFDHLSKAKTCKSLLKKHLTKEIFESLKEKKTSKEATLGDCILSGVLNLDSGVGVYAADPESYTEFAGLFDPVIKDYHKLKATDAISQPAMEFGDLENLEFSDLDPEGEMIVSTRIRVGRTHKDFAFPPVLTKEDRVTMEKKSVEALEALDGDLKGNYHPLTGMSKEVQDQMTADHFLFNDSDRFLKAACGYNDWPEGRGIFFSENKNFLVWVNEEDHLRIISMQKGGDLGAVYKRLVTGIKSMEEKLTFARDERLGYLTFCPTNLGTTLRASVHIKIPHLSARKDFKSICEKNKLQARGIHGEHTDSEGGVYDISNKRRLGLSEIDAVKEMANGVKEIIRLEKEAAAGKTKSCTVL